MFFTTGSFLLSLALLFAHVLFCFCVFFFCFFFVFCFLLLFFVLFCFVFCCFFFFFFFFFFLSCLALQSTGLEKRELFYMLLVHLFLCFARVNVCPFSLPLDVGCGLWLWHYLDFSINFLRVHESYSILVILSILSLIKVLESVEFNSIFTNFSL